ncbi:acyl-CoA--sterol O-acyltransferase 1-like [Melia azedarach]|uniref:Acyl-CoA--sterol O-acyltransferase 1-like n=1 Tax=Melia azedarach TaxID=155640 RepID=A0ACC1YPQ3_MELAZ|nr:acyl-CoA--sterol O-acyltransferase 1-like [Melia azedarach]
MEGEIKNLFQVWILAITCLTYCYHISARISAGIPRLLSFLPIIYLFIILPLKLTTIHLCGFTAFLLVWLANFKLILFAFDHGPLFPPPSKLSHFISISSLPINIKPSSNPSHRNPKSSSGSILLAIKVFSLALLLHVYNYRQYLHQNVILLINCLHIYLFLEIGLATCAAPVRAIFGFELELQFNEPYLATSLQDFWGRRWNLMVTGILRSIVYNPIRRISTRAIGYKWAPLPAVFAAFVVSGLMHEIVYYYLTRAPPTWEMTSFFILHGVCLIVEVAAKKLLSDRWRLHRAISSILLLGFMIMTSVWLFCPLLLKNGVSERMITELYSFSNLIKNKGLLYYWFWHEK